jgi:hypothetical protein
VKGYTGVAAVVTAAMPLGISKLGAIPAYESLQSILTTYASLFCFLVFGYVFFVRHSLARIMFGPTVARVSMIGQLAPLAFSCLSLISGVAYLIVLQLSIQAAQERAIDRGVNAASMKQVLTVTDFIDVKYAFHLIALYLAFFICAESAFVLMATREYLQDRLGLDDAELCRGKTLAIETSNKISA